jgi:hypothetical protein
LGNEVLSAKLEGKPILKNLPAVDRLIKVAAGKARVEQGAERNRLREKALEIRKANDEIRKEKWALEKAELEKARAEAEPEEEGPVEDRTDEMIEKVFGKNPYLNGTSGTARPTNQQDQHDAGPNHKSNN